MRFFSKDLHVSHCDHTARLSENCSIYIGLGNDFFIAARYEKVIYDLTVRWKFSFLMPLPLTEKTWNCPTGRFSGFFIKHWNSYMAALSWIGFVLHDIWSAGEKADGDSSVGTLKHLEFHLYMETSCHFRNWACHVIIIRLQPFGQSVTLLVQAVGSMCWTVRW